MRHGGFADVWKGHYRGREVAAKALKVYFKTDLGKVRRVGCPRPVVRINELIMSHTEVLPGGCDMEFASSPERATVVGRGDDRNPFRDGGRVDDER